MLNKVTIAKVILTIFAIIGVFLVVPVIHELSHKQDFKGLVFNDKICLIEYKTLNAFYSYSYKSEDSAEIERIQKYTEIKAYATSIFITVLVSYALIIVWGCKNGT